MVKSFSKISFIISFFFSITQMKIFSIAYTIKRTKEAFNMQNKIKLLFKRSLYSTTSNSQNKIFSHYNNKKLFSTFNSAQDDVLDDNSVEIILEENQKKISSFSYDCLPEETVFVIDGTSWLFNAYYSREHMTDYKEVMTTPEFSSLLYERMSEECKELFSSDESSDEEPSQLLFSCGTLVAMTMHFARFVRDIKPKYIAVAFDASKQSTFRKELYPKYKQKRQQTPSDLLPLFSVAPEIFQALGCKCFLQVGYEADDLMASIGKWSKDRGLNVVHVSSDKDMLQLVENGIHVMIPKGREMVGVDNVINKYGINPSQFCDFQAIMGDKVDNIPGISGIGQVTAVHLLKHFGSVENVYKQLGLIDIPAPSEEYQQLSPTSKELRSHLQSIMTNEKYKQSINELKICVSGSSNRAETILIKLFKCGYDNVLLYKKLVTLVDELDMNSIIMNNSKFSELDINNKLIIKNSSCFRYTGESRHVRNAVEEFFISINPLLLKPLRLLRQQYHKL